MKKLWESRALDSRIRSQRVGKSEMLLGHFAGPVCVMLLSSMLGSYLNVYYTDVLGIGDIGGGAFLCGFPIAVKLIDAFTFVAMGRLVDRTKTAQGKARPWILLSAPLLVLATILLFAVPEGSGLFTACWIFFSYNLFYSVAFTAYNTGHTLLAPLATRDSAERERLSLFTNFQGMAAGTLAAVLFPSVILPAIGVDKGRWVRLMTGMALLCFPLILLEYFFTRERVTEADRGQGRAPVLPLGGQLACCLKSHKWKVLMAYLIILQLSNSLSSSATFYYCNWVLGSYNDGITQLLFYAVGQAPLGIGIFLCGPLCRRFGRNRAMANGFLLAAAGTALCLLGPRSLPLVLAGQFIKSLGLISSIYMVTALLGEALDDVQAQSGQRCDGFSSSAYNVIVTLTGGAALAIFNLGLTRLGYIAPAAADIPAQNALVQNAPMQAFFIFAAFGAQLIAYPLLSLLLSPSLLKGKSRRPAGHLQKTGGGIG